MTRAIRPALHSTRRGFLSGSACLFAGALSGGYPRSVTAASRGHSFRLGTAEITILSDGVFTIPTSSALPEVAENDLKTLLGAEIASAALEAQTNVTLVRHGATLALIDTGAGPDFIPPLGKLGDRIEAAGINPDDITHVIFTHAHADHFWGVQDPFGDDSRFPKARHIMPRAERDFWLAADIEAKVPEAQRGMAVGTQRRLKALAEIITTAEPGAEIAPGIALIDTRGHTPGHVSVAVRSGSEELIILGDAITHATASFAAPEWRWGADIDSDAAIATRRRLLDDMASRKARLIGYHLPWPGLGIAERHGSAYRYVPA